MRRRSTMVGGALGAAMPGGMAEAKQGEDATPVTHRRVTVDGVDVFYFALETNLDDIVQAMGSLKLRI